MCFHFTNTGVVVGPDPIKARIDLWQKVLDAKTLNPPRLLTTKSLNKSAIGT